MNKRGPKRSLPLGLLALLLVLGGGVVWVQQSPFTLSQRGATTAQGGPSSEDRFEHAGARINIIRYEIQPGETLAQIAQRFSVALETLVGSNEPVLESLAELEPGQVLRVVQNGVLHQVKSGQTLIDIARTYSLTVDEIVAANDLSERKYIYAGEELFIPRVLESPVFRRFQLAGGKKHLFVWPLRGPLSSGFGPRRHPISGQPDFHEGIDLEIPAGTAVYAARAGRVILAGNYGGYGLTVILQHAHGYRTLYAHLSEIDVYRGQFIEGGQRLALSGNTGNSTGPHLHFEILQYGRPLNPLALLPPP